MIEQGKPEEASNKKKQLLAFTPSGVFNEKRLLTTFRKIHRFPPPGL
jgi:hypothetical protein